ncbi:MAG: sigma factor-like helix-turn-helix DNA-binding protein [Solirubrobacteraceae bacterium]
MPVTKTPEELSAIADPAERARLATELLAEHQSLVIRLAQIRRQAVAELRASGLSYAQVAERLGVTRGRIAQLKTSTLEREFFAGPMVTIATPLRATHESRPLVAQEDVEAAMMLTRFLNAADVATKLQHISPTGEIDLSPDALLAICGPKSSTAVQRLITADPLLEFRTDDAERWTIIDRASGMVYSSPIDDDPAADRDFAYVARLPRADSEHPILVIAGIHAIGSLGAASYLADAANLRKLHRAVGKRPFSMIVESQFTRSPLATLSARLAVEPRTHHA